MRVFLCDAYEGELSSTDETRPEWVKLDRLDSYTLLPSVKDIQDGLRARGN